MKPYLNSADYLNKTLNHIDLTQLSQNAPIVNSYLQGLITEFNHLIQNWDTTDFWTFFPRMMGLDTRFVLLNKLFSDDTWQDFSEEELIQLVETDYHYFNKELCGYDHREEPFSSLIFDVD